MKKGNLILRKKVKRAKRKKLSKIKIMMKAIKHLGRKIKRTKSNEIINNKKLKNRKKKIRRVWKKRKALYIGGL